MYYLQLVNHALLEGVLPGTNINPVGINVTGGKRLKLHKLITKMSKTNNGYY